jgi:hypothetical protein
VSTFNNEESDTYIYGWIMGMITKETEYMQWIIAAKLRYVVMIFEPCRCLVVSV